MPVPLGVRDLCPGIVCIIPQPRLPAAHFPPLCTKRPAWVLKGHPERLLRHCPACLADTGLSGEPVSIVDSVVEVTAGVTIREAGLHDVAGMVEIEELTAGFWSSSDFVKELGQERGLVLVAEDGGSPQGLMGLVVMWVIADEAQFLEVAVHPGAQCRGIGTRLMSEALALSTRRVKRKAGRGAAILEVGVDNQPAIHLYTKLGFKIVGQRRDYYPDGSSAYLMRLSIS